MHSLPSVVYGSDFIFIASRVSFVPFLYSPIPFYKGHWYVGFRVDGVIGRNPPIPSYDISRICSITHITYSVVDPVLTVVFQISFGAFRVVVSRIVIYFTSRSSDTLSGPSLSITSAYGQMCHVVFSRQPVKVLGLV